MSTTVINGPAFEAQLKAMLNAEMQKAAEPLVQAALKGIEVAMRERLAQMLIGRINRDFSMNIRGDILTINLQQAIRS